MKPDYDAQKEHRWRFRFVERRVLLFIGDLMAGFLALAFSIYFWSRQSAFLGFSVRFLLVRVPGWFYLLPLVWIFLLMEMYDIRRAASWQETFRGVSTAAVLGTILYLGVYFTSPPESLPRMGVAVFVFTAVILTLGWRLLYIRVFTAPQFMRRVLLFGGGKSGTVLLHSFNQLDPKPFYMIGIIDDDPQKMGQEIKGYPVLGNGAELLDLIRERQISDIIVAITGEIQGRSFQALLDAQEMGVDIIRMPVAYEDLNHRVPIRILEADWILRSFVDETGVSGVYHLGKRILDIIGALIGIGLLLLLLPCVSLATLLDSGWPIFYLQTRLGRSGKPYKIIKFRTMRQDAEQDGEPQWASENDERITRVGRVLRKTHIDEVPQFINVLRGEMSLVGPRSERPKLVEQLQEEVPFYRARLLVKPGLTGWAQVNYGYPETIEGTIDKLEYDLYYIKHRSLLLDLRIIFRTPDVILGLRGK
jgi:exopolysaccharide biosynthesis polyprenyl glycosylphosphotransferase